MIKFEGYCKKITDLPESELPENAVQFHEAETTGEFIFASSLWLLPIWLFIICLVMLKRHLSGIAFSFFPANSLGVLLSILFILPHELLHAICFPQGEDVHIYFVNFGACCCSPAAISKKRFSISLKYSI